MAAASILHEATGVSARQWHYGKYITWYISEVLEEDQEVPFMHDDNVCHDKDGPWHGVPPDQFGEETYIRYGTPRGGLVGITLS